MHATGYGVLLSVGEHLELKSQMRYQLRDGKTLRHASRNIVDPMPPRKASSLRFYGDRTANRHWWTGVKAPRRSR